MTRRKETRSRTEKQKRSGGEVDPEGRQHNRERGAPILVLPLDRVLDEHENHEGAGSAALQRAAHRSARR
jgi:hypothetical protein